MTHSPMKVFYFFYQQSIYCWTEFCSCFVTHFNLSASQPANLQKSSPFSCSSRLAPTDPWLVGQQRYHNLGLNLLIHRCFLKVTAVIVINVIPITQLISLYHCLKCSFGNIFLQKLKTGSKSVMCLENDNIYLNASCCIRSFKGKTGKRCICS